MITLSLDEFGDFENLKEKKEDTPVFIAGIWYEDQPEKEDTNIEKERIQAYYRAVIEDVKKHVSEEYKDQFTYPEALHSNTDRAFNSHVVGPVKQCVQQTMKEFLKHGTYRGRKLSRSLRQGKYRIFAIVKSDDGKKNFRQPTNNILASDDYASNLYFHMARDLLLRLAFHNPLCPHMDALSFQIATRSSGNIPRNSKKAQEYQELGHPKSNKSENSREVFFQLTNADVYRTLLEEEILDTKKQNANIAGFRVTSICYKEKARNMEFLYLADSICSILSYRISGEHAGEWLKEMIQRSSDLTNEDDNFIFVYDEVDSDYAEAREAYEQKDYYSALGILYDVKQKEGVFSEYYRRRWFRLLEDEIIHSTDDKAFAEAIGQLEQSLYSNTLDQEKFFYIFSVLEKAINDLKEGKTHRSITKKLEYQLYDCGMGAYCHLGNSYMAQQYFEKCQKLARYVDLNTFLCTRNRQVVFLGDCFAYGQALPLAGQNIACCESLHQLRLSCTPEDDEAAYDEELGKAYSQRGQMYAFLRDDRAETDFRDALACFEVDSANYKITQSYLMHYYLGCGRFDDYQKEAYSYFGQTEDLLEQLNYMITEGSTREPLINMKFALYLYVRALYAYRQPELTGKIWRELNHVERNFGKKIRKKGWKLSGHPSELIFFYLALLARDRNDLAMSDQYEDRIGTSTQMSGPTIEAITAYAQIRIENEKGDIRRRNDETEKLCTFMAEHFENCQEAKTLVNWEQRMEWLSSKLTFMYC